MPTVVSMSGCPCCGDPCGWCCFDYGQAVYDRSGPGGPRPLYLTLDIPCFGISGTYPLTRGGVSQIGCTQKDWGWACRAEPAAVGCSIGSGNNVVLGLGCQPTTAAGQNLLLGCLVSMFGAAASTGFAPDPAAYRQACPPDTDDPVDIAFDLYSGTNTGCCTATLGTLIGTGHLTE